MRDSIHSSRYSPVCNVLRQWKNSLVPTYRVYRLYDTTFQNAGNLIFFPVRSSKVDTSMTDLRRSTHRSSVFEGQHIHLRRSTHRSSKVDTSISEGRHIVTSIFEGRHTKGDTSIFESRHIDHRSSKIEGGNITPTIRRRILSTTALLSPWSRRSYTRSYVHA